MRSRRSPRVGRRFVLAVVLAAAVWSLAAAGAVAATPLLLAAESLEEEQIPEADPVDPALEIPEEPGLDPMPVDATDNPAAPPPYDANFLWGASAGLLVLTVLGLLALGGLYWLLVVRPGQRTDA